MKHYLRKLIIVFISLYVAYSLIPTIKLGNDPKNLAFVIGSFFLASIFIKPFFSLVLLPINFMTISLISLALNIAIIFALISFLPGLGVEAYNFPGANLSGIILEPISLNKVATIVAVGFIITVVQKVLHILFD
ncbi:phage holin family protein [Candidatus Curtissbacteria bacterium]|nr:phage holin family protein [Candidatus Curtissbacteria bacterium]